MTNLTRVEVRCYRFTCPDCGMTDFELGHLATADEVHCMVCLIDEERHVVLRRWLVDVPEPQQDAVPQDGPSRPDSPAA